MTATAPTAGDGAPPEAVDLVVTGAELVVTMDDARRELPGGWVACHDGTIVAVGASTQRPPPATEVLQANGCLVTPGLVNTHHHLYQNLARAFRPVTAVPFDQWLGTLAPLWARLDDEAVHVSAWVGLVELALGGCTTTTDHLYLHPPDAGDLLAAEITAARDVGMRFHPTFGTMDITRRNGGYAPDTLARDPEDILADAQRHVARHHDPAPRAMTRVALAPAATYLASEALLRGTAELAERLDVRLHTHLAYEDFENEWCQRHYGRSSVEHAEACGWGTDRVWVAHAHRVSPADIARFARWGTGVAHCPSSTMLNHGGLTPITELRAAGVPIGIGVDGSAGSDSASMWLETRMAMLAARYRTGPASWDARDVLELATRGGARCLGRDGELGVLAPGAAADLVCWPLDGPSFAGALSDPVEAWARCGPSSARHTVVGGHPLVRDGRPVHPDLDERLAMHRRAAAALQGLSHSTR